jgi:ParB-like chromosome segregation protein Spo0J
MQVSEEHQISFIDDIDEQLEQHFPKAGSDLFGSIEASLKQLGDMDIDDRVSAINKIRLMISKYSPFNTEPVDCVQWVRNNSVTANEYNPNQVAPPEMKLLELSIMNDGYTQPIVSWSNPEKETIEVIDGFHRNRVGKESKVIQQRVHGYLPIVDIRTEQSSKSDRMASTIRHNRARGKHQVDAMSGIVIELKNRNWRNARIAKELGMDEEEVLRLCQISGMEELFSDKDFSNAWEAPESDEAWEDITDEVSEEEISAVRIPNDGKGNRVFHTYDKWECHKAGFYAQNVEGKTADECREAYRLFLSDLDGFRDAATAVISEWVMSCEHYLTNFAMNRIAWIGQAAMCYATGVPSKFCGGFNLLNDKQQEEANQVALDVLNDWLLQNGRDPIDMDEALSAGRQVEIY